jgi:hypothetical protein
MQLVDPIPPLRKPLFAAVAILVFHISSPLHAAPADAAPADAAPQPAIAGYADYDTFAKQVEALTKPGVAEVSSLATTLGHRKFYLITVSIGPAEAKPAILVVGNVHAPQLVGSELAVRMARRLIERADKDAATKDLLTRYAFYIIPRPTPDASEAFFRRPSREREGNLRPAVDFPDADGPRQQPADLNGDGLITMLRVASDTGRYRPNPDDPRVMIPIDPQKNEHGQYDLYVEGHHPRGDRQRPSPTEGVAFNRNFPFRYPVYQPLAGPNAVSEIETRAVADFAFDHPNIAVVFSFTPEDNLMHTWKPGGEQGRVKSSLQADDVAEYELLAKKYRDLRGGSDAPDSPAGQGSFSEWAYFQYGRWSLAARGWWIPKVEAAAPAAQAAAVAPVPVVTPPKGDSPPPRHRHPGGRGPGPSAERPESASQPSAAEAVNALRWFDREKIGGFVPWTSIQDSDFPDEKVEVGGFKPFYLLNPPAKELNPLAEKHTDYLLELARLLPQVKIHSTKAESLGGGIFRISVVVLNEGYLPTSSEVGQITGQVYPLYLRLTAPQGTHYITGTPRTELGRLRGGEKTEWTWLVRPPEGGAKPAEATIRVSAPAVGSDSATVELK